MTTNPGTAQDWIRRFHPDPDAPHRLVCFPHAGGSAKYFVPVARSLSPLCDVLAIQYPGRQDRRGESNIDNLEHLAAIIVDVLLPLADRPLTFFGHSMGATIAFEAARRLEAHNTVLTDDRRAVQAVAPGTHAQMHCLRKVLPVAGRAALPRTDDDLNWRGRVVGDRIRIRTTHDCDISRSQSCGQAFVRGHPRLAAHHRHHGQRRPILDAQRPGRIQN